MKQPDLTALFNQFSGKEVSVETGPVRAIDHGFGDIEVENGTVPKQDDAILNAMADTAKKEGLKLLVHFKNGTVFTRDLYSLDEVFNDLKTPVANRVNAYAEEGADGKYRITSTFTLG